MVESRFPKTTSARAPGFATATLRARRGAGPCRLQPAEVVGGDVREDHRRSDHGPLDALEHEAEAVVIACRPG